MCEPATITMIALAASAAVVGQVEKQKAASRSARIYEETSKIAKDNYNRSIARTGDQLLETKEQMADESQKRQIEMLQAKAGAAVSGAEAGVQGDAVSSLFQEYERVHGVNQVNTAAGFRNYQGQATENLRGIAAQARSNIASSAPLPAPSFLGTALQIGSMAAGATASYNAANRTITPSPSTPPSSGRDWSMR